MVVHPFDFDDVEIQFDGRKINTNDLRGHSVDILVRKCTVTIKGNPVEISFPTNQGFAVYKFPDKEPQPTGYRRADDATDLLAEIIKKYH